MHTVGSNQIYIETEYKQWISSVSDGQEIHVFSLSGFIESQIISTGNSSSETYKTHKFECLCMTLHTE